MDPARRSHSLAARHNAAKEDVHEPLSYKLRSAYAGPLGDGAHGAAWLGCHPPNPRRGKEATRATPVVLLQ